MRQGLRAGVPSYSLKEVEALAQFARCADVKSGTRAVLAYEQWMETRDENLLASIAAYNDEDCRATLALRDWLVAHRPEDARWFEAVAAEARDDADAGERDRLRAGRSSRASLPGSRAGSPASSSSTTGARRGPAGGGTSSGCDHMTEEDLLDDTEAIAGLAPVGGPVSDKRSFVHTLAFPPQQHKLGPGDQPFDPATKKSAGTIAELDDVAGTLDAAAGGPTPQGRSRCRGALVPQRPLLGPTSSAGALSRASAASILADDGRYVPLLRDPHPRAKRRLAVRGRAPGGAVPDDSILAAQRALVAGLDGELSLRSQGPPGTGKTWTGARLVDRAHRRQVRRVGVAATRPQARSTTCSRRWREAATEEGSFALRGLKKASAGNDESFYDSP